MNYNQNIRAYERWSASKEIKQNRTQTVNVGSAGKLIGWAFGLLGCDVPGRSKCLQRSCEMAILIETFCQTKVALQRFTVFIKKDVSRYKSAVNHVHAMGVRAIL